MSPEELKSSFIEAFPDRADDCEIEDEHLVARIPLNSILSTFRKLKDDPVFDFKMLLDMTVVDWLDRNPRFDMVYHLYSVEKCHRIRIKSAVNDGESVPSLTDLWLIANWFEREMWDLYGIKFSGHPNLKRILLYDEFKGHPLRKDYPFDKRQPRIQESFPSKSTQYKVEGLKIHRP